jgi:hypothetical protein
MKFVARLAGDRYCSGFSRMLKLPVTPALPHNRPSIIFEQS